MADVVLRRAPFGGEAAGGRHAERAVRVVLYFSRRVVDADVDPLPVPELLARVWRRGRNEDLQKRIDDVLPRPAVTRDFDDVAEHGVGTAAPAAPAPNAGWIQVQPAQQSRAVDVSVGDAGANLRGERVIDAGAHARVAHHFEIRGQQILVDRWDDSDVARVGKRRVDDVQLLLPESVDAQRLLVDAAAEPVVEDPRARAQRRLAVLERRPRDPESRPERVEVVQMRLRLVAEAGAERQPFADADVVLDVHARLQIPVIDVRIADAPRVAARQSGLVRREALERVRAEIIRRVVRPERSAVEHDARTE